MMNIAEQISRNKTTVDFIDLNLYAIYDASPAYNSPEIDGFIGLAGDFKIDDQSLDKIFSIYVDSDQDKTGYIQLGGFNADAVQGEIFLLNTDSTKFGVSIETSLNKTKIGNHYFSV